MKTMKQIADALGMDKQRVYRYIKKHDIEGTRRADGAMMYDEAVENAIIQGLTGSDEAAQSGSYAPRSASKNATFEAVIEGLMKQLDVKDAQLAQKDRQIEELTLAVRVQAESINADRKNELAETIIDGHKQITDGQQKAPDKKPGLWGRIFKRGQG